MLTIAARSDNPDTDSGEASSGSVLRNLTIRNFRNIASLDLELPSEGLVVIGENGHGKTSLLEAIYYLVIFRSLRGARDRELVRFGSAGFFVGGTADVRITAGYEVLGRRKKVAVNGDEARRLGEVVGLVSAVPFTHADRDMAAGGPAARRRYLDVLLSLSEPGYMARLTQTRAALKQRNTALRRGRGEEAWTFDEPLVRAGASVWSSRERWVSRWTARYKELCRELGESKEPEMRYQSGAASQSELEEELRRTLFSSRERDLKHAATTAGPHRHDLRLTLGGSELRVYGSAGQQRTAAVALRILEAETLRESGKRRAIALFDDVFAELDGPRQGNLLRLINEALPGQAVITAARESEVPAALLDRPRWRIRGGHIAAER